MILKKAINERVVPINAKVQTRESRLRVALDIFECEDIKYSIIK